MLRVNKNNPCPICGKPDWCLVAENGSAAICRRISEGSVKEAGEAGWLHFLKDTPPEQRRKYVKPHPPPGPVKNWVKLSGEYRENFNNGKKMEEAVAMFGVSAMALDELVIGWDPVKKAHTFPMWGGDCGGYHIIGIRLRPLNGHHFCVPGSKNGIFWPASVMADAKEILFIAEGPSDCAALLDLGFSPIGRASCGTGYKHIKEMIEHYERQVVIVADKDEAKFTPDGKKFYPGYDGALKLARSIKPFVRSVRLVKPPAKNDIRDWYRAGATRAAVMALVKNARFI